MSNDSRNSVLHGKQRKYHSNMDTEDRGQIMLWERPMWTISLQSHPQVGRCEVHMEAFHQSILLRAGVSFRLRLTVGSYRSDVVSLEQGLSINIPGSHPPPELCVKLLAPHASPIFIPALVLPRPSCFAGVPDPSITSVFHLCLFPTVAKTTLGRTLLRQFFQRPNGRHRIQLLLKRLLKRRYGTHNLGKRSQTRMKR